jgi:hypothetical protein
VPEEVCNTLVTLIEQSPELQAYAVHKMYLSLTRDIVQVNSRRSSLRFEAERFSCVVATAGSSSSVDDRRIRRPPGQWSDSAISH